MARPGRTLCSAGASICAGLPIFLRNGSFSRVRSSATAPPQFRRVRPVFLVAADGFRSFAEIRPVGGCVCHRGGGQSAARRAAAVVARLYQHHLNAEGRHLLREALRVALDGVFAGGVGALERQPHQPVDGRKQHHFAAAFSRISGSTC